MVIMVSSTQIVFLQYLWNKQTNKDFQLNIINQNNNKWIFIKNVYSVAPRYA